MRRRQSRPALICNICLIGFVSALSVIAACEARTPEPSAQHPIKPPEPQPSPATNTEPAPTGQLAQIAGVHYLEFVTAGADPQAKLPMIIAIHGLGDSPEGFRGLLEDFDQPARVIVPRGLDAQGPGWSWFPTRVSELAEGNTEQLAQLAIGIKLAADTLAPAIEQLAAQRPTTGKPIVTGFSQGGMLSFALAIHHRELLSAALPIGGWLPEPLWPTGPAPTSPIPIIAFHGEADTIVPYSATVTAVAQLEQAGYPVELITYAGGGHSISPAMRADLFDALRTNLDK